MGIGRGREGLSRRRRQEIGVRGEIEELRGRELLRAV
jgi:hypothetical protein